MKVVESVPVTEDAIKKHKEHGVRTVKDIIESASNTAKQAGQVHPDHSKIG